MTELDLTKKEPSASPAPIASASETVSSSSAVMEGWTRIALAGALVGLLVVLTIGSGLYIATYPSKESAIDAFLKLTFTPVVGLVGSVVGFYFGARTASGSGGG